MDVVEADLQVGLPPFTITLPFEKRARAADYELLEAACVEGEKSAEAFGFADPPKP
jgi:hypothetical protein